MNPTTIAVMAGTPVDTRMGCDFLLARNPSLRILPYPVSPSAGEQHLFQLSAPTQREEAVRSLLRRARDDGAQALLVYCNSLSGALDFPALCAQERLPVVTPLQAQQQLAANCTCMGLLAANIQSLHGIQQAIVAAHPAPPDILGVALLPVVKAIEDGLPPQDILERFGLHQLLRFFEHAGAQQIVLGCTHFPYLLEALSAATPLPVRNPDDAIYTLLFPPVTTP